MGVGGFLSAQAEGEHYRFMARQTHERVSVLGGEAASNASMNALDRL